MTTDTKDDGGDSPWNECEHEWSVCIDSQFHSAIEEEVVCIKCGCPGAKDVETGEVYWPAT